MTIEKKLNLALTDGAIPLLFIRHAPTDWNLEKKLQGRTDIPLNSDSLKNLKHWHLPLFAKEFDIYSSPLTRCIQTAEGMGAIKPNIEHNLIEMDFGDFEGQRLKDLREKLGPALQENEDKGLDFLPPNGESPHMVQDRLGSFFQKLLHKQSQGAVLFTHKGVIRAAMAQACGWNMLGKPPYKIIAAKGCLFLLSPNKLSQNGELSIVDMTIPLTNGPKI
ncbi:MAG: histidine phosphatase family protein [Alphaproteobacteria bacterium]|nr:histidine phosphatase family protein [Alphaproteobacteria bacterium]